MAKCTARKQVVDGIKAVQIEKNVNSPVKATCFCVWWAVQMKVMAKCTAGKQVVDGIKAVQIEKNVNSPVNLTCLCVQWAV